MSFISIYMHICIWLSGKESACNAEDTGLIPQLARRRKCQPTPVFLPGNPVTEEPGRIQSMELQRV